METTQDFINLFVDTTTGELLYFIAIFAFYQAALLMAFDQRRRSKNEIAAGRYTVALAFAQITWLALMGGSLYGVTAEDTASIMPPLEYTVNAIVVVCLSWGLLTAEYVGKPRALLLFTILVVVMLVVGFVTTINLWNPDEDFNRQSYSVSWAFSTALLAGANLLLLVTKFKQVADIPLKIIFWGLLLAGYIYTLIELSGETLTGDASGSVRWAFLSSSALVIVIVYRMVMDRMTSVFEEVASYADSISKPQRAITPEQIHAKQSETADPYGTQQIMTSVTGVTAGTSSMGGRNESLELMKALGIMLDKEETQAIPKQISVAVAEVLKADVVALASYDDAHWADILAAYDNPKKQFITGMSINLAEQPTMLNAIESKRQRKLEMEPNADELKDLYTRLDILQTGPTYLQPINRHGKVVGLLIVGLPYTRRDLRLDELRILESLGPISARLLVISRTAMINRVQAEERAIMQIVDGLSTSDGIVENTAVLAVRKEMQESLARAQEEINELSQYIEQLQSELDSERYRISEFMGDNDEAMSITQRIRVIATEREILQQERQKLAIALREAQATLAGVTADDESDLLQAMIENMRQEIGDLKEQKARLESQLTGIRSGGSAQMPQVLQALNEEKQQISTERDQIAFQLRDTQQQLEALGIEGGVQGLAKQLAKLTEERLYYKTQAERAALDREVLLKERQTLEIAIAKEAEREGKLLALEDELARLLQDREAFSKNRDSFKTERDALQTERDRWFEDRARMLAHNDSLKLELDETLETLSQANQERQEFMVERNQLLMERDQLRAELSRVQTERDTVLARLDGDRERLETLGEEGIGALTEMIDDLAKERTLIEAKLLETQQQVEALQRELKRAAQETPDSAKDKLAIDIDVIISLAQELRTPLSVIMGYTDTVLTESVGILGALQRKLLTRVKANVDHLTYLVEELVQVVAIDSGDLKLQPQKINLVDVIDDAITANRYKFNEKGIVIDFDIAQNTLEVQADLEAMRQIINHLIQNAYLVSPTDGTVRIEAHYESEFQLGETPQPVAYVAITDHGGGVNPADEKRVFSRLYRADNPLIAGLGDTGVGMSITKALIEAHGGKIWLETKQGIGNTFKFVMPISQPILSATQLKANES